MTDFALLADAVVAGFERALAKRASALLSPDTMLTLAEAARSIRGLGYNAARHWLEQQEGLVIWLPAASFGAHRKRDVGLVRWGDVVERLETLRDAPMVARGLPDGLEVGGL